MLRDRLKHHFTHVVTIRQPHLAVKRVFLPELLLTDAVGEMWKEM